MQGNKLKQNYIQGRLNNVDLITSHGAKEVVYGLVTVSSDTTMVMRKPLIVNSLGGEKKANRICPKVSLNIKGKNFEATL